MDKTLEFCNDKPVEFREDSNTLVGYGAVFFRSDIEGTEFQPWVGHRERIAPGAFTAAIGRDNVRALFNHSSDNVLGNSEAGTLRLAQDKIGLRYEIDLPDTSIGRDVREMVKRKDVTGSSFAFTVDDEETFSTDGEFIREIRGVTLYDVGPVTYPAYSATSVSARSVDWLKREFEARLPEKIKEEKTDDEPAEEVPIWDQRQRTIDAYELTLEPKPPIIPHRR